MNSFTPEIYKHYTTLPLVERNPYERVFYFVMRNCNENLMKSLEEAYEFIAVYAENFFEDKSFILNLLNFVIYGISLLVSIVLIPFIYKARKNMLEIIVLFLNIDKESIQTKLGEYANARKGIVTFFEKIKKEFGYINFDVEQKYKGNKTEEPKQSNANLNQIENINKGNNENNENNENHENNENECKVSAESEALLEMKSKIDAVFTER